MLKGCRVTSYRRTSNLVDADVMVRGGEAEKRPPNAVLQNEEYVDGFELTLVPEDGGPSVTRFLSDADINTLVFKGETGRSPLTLEQMEFFCQKLTEREKPVTVAAFDSNVDLDRVQRMPGITGDSLIDDEAPGMSSMPDGGA